MATNLVKINTNASIVSATQDFIEAWLKSEKLRGQADETCNAYRHGLGRFTEWLMDAGISNPTPKDIATYRADKLAVYSSQTVNLSLSAIRSFYRYLVETGEIVYSVANDVRGAKRVKSNRHKRSELSGGEVMDILQTCDNTVGGIRDRAMITLMAYCGLRTIEVARADISNLKTENNRMVLAVQGKGHVEADEIVIIPRNQERVLRLWLSERIKLGGDPALFVSLSYRHRGGRLSTRAIRKSIMDRYKVAGIFSETKTTHSLRHSAITSALRHGATPRQAQAMARHASFDTTLIYDHEVKRTENPAEDLIEYQD